MLDRIIVTKITWVSKGPVLDLQTCLGKPIVNAGMRIIIPGLKFGFPMATLEASSKAFGHLMK